MLDKKRESESIFYPTYTQCRSHIHTHTPLTNIYIPFFFLCSLIIKRWIDYQNVSEEEEREHLTKTNAIHMKMCGEKPLGLYQGKPNVNTRKLCIEQGDGFIFRISPSLFLVHTFKSK